MRYKAATTEPHSRATLRNFAFHLDKRVIPSTVTSLQRAAERLYKMAEVAV